MDVTLKLVCRKLPGIEFEGRAPVHLGIQKGKEVVEFVPADKRQVTYEVPLSVEERAGRVRLRSPFIQGKPEEPFIYLSWGVMKGRTFDMFRRAKVRLSHLKPAALRKAAASGKPIEAVVTCTDAQGGPLCASVKDSHITWKV